MLLYIFFPTILFVIRKRKEITPPETVTTMEGEKKDFFQEQNITEIIVITPIECRSNHHSKPSRFSRNES